MWKRGERIPVDNLVRLLSKNSIARFYWICSKQLGVSLFPASMDEWSTAHLLFTNWCMFYDSMYESIDRPPDRIIDDDEKLEQWNKHQREQRELRYEENYVSVGFKDGGISAFKADEVYVVEEGSW